MSATDQKLVEQKVRQLHQQYIRSDVDAVNLKHPSLVDRISVNLGFVAEIPACIRVAYGLLFLVLFELLDEKTGN